MRRRLLARGISGVETSRLFRLPLELRFKHPHTGRNKKRQHQCESEKPPYAEIPPTASEILLFISDIFLIVNWRREGLRFRLGFRGKYFMRGAPEEAMNGPASFPRCRPQAEGLVVCF